MGRHRDEQAATASRTESSGLVVLGVIVVLALMLMGFAARGLFMTGDAAADDSGAGPSPAVVSTDDEHGTLHNVGDGELHDDLAKTATDAETKKRSQAKS